MGVGIYKSNQGYYTRLISAIAFGLLVMMGVVWMWEHLSTVRIGEIQPVYIQGAAAVIVISIFGLLGYYFIGKNSRVVDFMIATEGEMKKVNWSTRRELLGSTWVVIGLTLLIAILCFVFDLIFQSVFSWMNVLET